jgi:hypothetical protein
MKNQHSTTKSTGAIAYGAVALWFIFAFVMGIQGNYVSSPTNPPLLLGLTFIVPILVFIVLYWTNTSLRAFAHTLNLKVTIGLNLWRLGGVDFLIRYAQGHLPAGFAFPAGIGDVITGLTAIPLLLAISRNTPTARKRFVAWNVFGLIDLILAVSLGILHSQSSFGILAGSGPTTLLMGEFPRSMIPTFFVPSFILLHLLALARRNEFAVKRPKETNETIRSNLSSRHQEAL